MKKLLFLICLFSIALRISAQSESFEGSLVYKKKFYDTATQLEKYDLYVSIQLKFTIKGSFSLIELVAEDNLLEGKSYSILTNSDKKEQTLMATIANKKVALKIDTSHFNSSKISKIISSKDTTNRNIAGLTCKSGYALKISESGTQDSIMIWYTTSYPSIPYQFDTHSGPGLIVSMQQDASSYWELSEIKAMKIDPRVFSIPIDYLPMEQSELQDFISTLDQLQIEED
jgi:hypothetical protein